MPMIDFSVVVLPAPLRPSSVTTSPARTSKVTPWRMCDSPYHACRPFTVRIGASAMPDPHVGLAYVWIVGNSLVVAFDQHTPAGQHGDPLAQVRDDGEIVLDHQHGTVGSHRLDQRRDAVDVLMAHPGRRLVEQ